MTSPQRRKGSSAELTKSQKRFVRGLAWAFGTVGFGLILWHVSVQSLVGGICAFFAASLFSEADR